MIFDLIENAGLYKGLSARLDAALAWLQTTNLSALDNGRVDIADGVFVNVSDVTRKKAAEGTFEYHKRYLDIQFSLFQEEHIGVLPVKEVPAFSDFDAERDIALSSYSPLGQDMRLTPGRFLILFPTDAHKPGIGEGAGRKGVVKVLWE